MARNAFLSVDDIVKTLGLEPHPEGGFYKETHRSPQQNSVKISADGLPKRFSGPRSVCTSIYYLLTRESFSAIHRLESTEVLNFYFGASVEVLKLHPDGSGAILRLGDIREDGCIPQLVIEPGVWFGMRVSVPGEVGDYALLGATVSPGFEFDDFEIAGREPLIAQFPEWEADISLLTR